MEKQTDEWASMPNAWGVYWKLRARADEVSMTCVAIQEHTEHSGKVHYQAWDFSGSVQTVKEEDGVLYCGPIKRPQMPEPPPARK